MECEVYCPRRLLRTGYGRFGGFWGGILICVVPMSQFCFSSSVFSAVKIHEGPSLVFVSFFLFTDRLISASCGAIAFVANRQWLGGVATVPGLGLSVCHCLVGNCI